MPNRIYRISAFDFMTEEQRLDVVNNIGSIDVTVPCQQSLDYGTSTVFFPEGTYLIRGLEIGSTFIDNTIMTQRKVVGKGIVKLKLSDQGTTAFLINPRKHFITIENFIIESLVNDRTKYGILFAGSNAHTKIRDVNIVNFQNGVGIEYRQTVNTLIERVLINNCMFGLLFQKYNNVPCTTVTVNRAYITGCKRAISHFDAVGMNYIDAIAEVCGSKETSDGAYHFEGGHCLLQNTYGEANLRNFVFVNCDKTFVGSKYIVDDMENNPPAPDIIV